MLEHTLLVIHGHIRQFIRERHDAHINLSRGLWTSSVMEKIVAVPSGLKEPKMLLL